MIFAFPVSFIFTKAHYAYEGLGLIGNINDHFFNGVKLSYMFLMVPLGILLELPWFFIILFPVIIVFLKIQNIGVVPIDQIISGILGIVLAFVIIGMKKRGKFNYFSSSSTNAPQSHMHKFLNSFSIFAWVVFLTFFLSYFVGNNILVYLSEYFRASGDAGFFPTPPKEIIGFILGIPPTYTFFVALLFGLFDRNKSWNSYFWTLFPAFILSLFGIIWFFWTSIFFIVGIFISKGVIKIIDSNFHYQQ